MNNKSLFFEGKVCYQWENVIFITKNDYAKHAPTIMSLNTCQYVVFKRTVLMTINVTLSYLRIKVLLF